ncbi:hypothetical protein LTR04_002730, partial [Oleoguttula sp. CCFEE 6159]
MEGPNTILTLVAVSDSAKAAFALSTNRDRYLPPSFDDYSSRESTPFPNHQEESDGAGSGHRLQLAFDRPPKDIQQGFVFGTDPQLCDVLLGERRGQGSISGRHFCITLDAQGRVIVRDFSKCGTIVSYDGQARDQKRSYFTWIIFQGLEKIKVHLAGTNFKFQIKLAEHENCEPKYLEHVNTFLEERRTLEESGPAVSHLDMLDIHSRNTTAAPSEPLSPRQGPIYLLHEELGRGEFGRVYKVINKRIVQFVDFRDEPSPLLVMEYLTFGNLQEQHRDTPIAIGEAVALLCQGLQGLEYLHSRGFAHRDIKPANILVASRVPFSIKLADFGLAKDVSALKTCCGTYLYTAPEIWKGSGYTSAVDIWSLGVVVFEFAYGLPKPERGSFHARDWDERLMGAVMDWDPDDLIGLLAARVLKVTYQERLSASDCLKEVSSFHPAGFPMQELEVRVTTPTEKMSSSVIMEAVRRLQYSKDPELDKEAETFTGHLTFTPREYSQIPTRVQDYPADEIPKPVLGQGQRQTTGSATREASHSRRLKRQLDETHDVEGASVRQQRASRSQASTGAPIEELPGYVQMTVEGKPISMRKADYWLNATQILLIAGKTENQRKEILDVLRKHTTVEVQKATKWTHHSTSWVCYE